MNAQVAPSPLVDIILATVGRTDEVAQFLQALRAQSYRHFRLIVVDQNVDDRLGTLLDRYRQSMSIVVVKSERGLSRARNAGLALVAGDIVTFPDDDCRYPPDFLSDAVGLLRANPRWDGVTGRVVDEDGNPSSARWDVKSGSIDRRNVWRRAVSTSIVLRRSVVNEVGLFDESLGLGSGTAYGSGEETDYILRAILAGYTLTYQPSLTVLHPENRREATKESIAAGRRYGAGMGRVLRKHHYPSWFAAYHVGRAAGGALIALAHGRPAEARFHYQVAVGRLQGALKSL